jgi:hypothetical protein
MVMVSLSLRDLEAQVGLHEICALLDILSRSWCRDTGHPDQLVASQVVLSCPAKCARSRRHPRASLVPFTVRVAGSIRRWRDSGETRGAMTMTNGHSKTNEGHALAGGTPSPGACSARTQGCRRARTRHRQLRQLVGRTAPTTQPKRIHNARAGGTAVRPTAGTPRVFAPFCPRALVRFRNY